MWRPNNTVIQLDLIVIYIQQAVHQKNRIFSREYGAIKTACILGWMTTLSNFCF